MLAETLLSLGSASLARTEAVYDRERLFQVLAIVLGYWLWSYTYCDAFLELKLEAFARIFNRGRNMLIIVTIALRHQARPQIRL